MIKDPESQECPMCAERVKKEALKCKHCGEDFSAHNSGALGHAETVVDGIGSAIWGLFKFIAIVLLILVCLFFIFV